MDKIYLDNAATTPLLPEVKKYVVSLLDQYANPSSLYRDGLQSRKIIEDSRLNVAKFINADKREILFTSSGSASNTLAIHGYMEKHSCKLLYSPIAHKSILNCVKSYSNASPLKVDKYGIIDLDDLKDWLKSVPNQAFVVIDYANSEIGTCQDIVKIINLVHYYHGIVYLDCTGSISQIPLDVKSIDVDMAGFSAHKIGGLKGCGVLYKRQTIKLSSLIYGEQEHGLFAGTENILGIASLGKAVEHYNYNTTSLCRDYVYTYIKQNIKDTYLVGSSPNNRLPQNLYMCFKGVQGEILTRLLDIKNIQVSTGSACNSQSLQPSPALLAIGMDTNDMYSCIRMSFSGNETLYELDYICETLNECVSRLRNIQKRTDQN